MTDLLDLGRHDEVAFGQPVHFVRPERDLYLAPRQEYVRVMSLLLGEFANLVNEIKRLAEVREVVAPMQMMPVDDLPLRQLFLQPFQFRTLQSGHAATAWHTSFARQFRHFHLLTSIRGRMGEKDARSWKVIAGG